MSRDKKFYVVREVLHNNYQSCNLIGPYHFNRLTAIDAYTRHRNSAACYQLAQSVLKIGSALAERVGQGGVGGTGGSGWVHRSG